MFGDRLEILHGVYPAFADCSITAQPYAHIMSYVSKRYGLGLSQFEERLDTQHGALFESILFAFPQSISTLPSSHSGGPSQREARTWFDTSGILIGRPGRSTNCLLGVALKGGHNAEHHNHNDVGSYVVVAGKSALLLDPGSEIYTARTFSLRRYESKILNSFGHPVPLVAGQLQIKGVDACAKVLRTEFTDETDTLVFDIHHAYAVETLVQLTRTFTYSRIGKGSLTVTDEVAFSEPQTFGTALITMDAWQAAPDNKSFVVGKENALRVDIHAEGADFTLVSEIIDEDVRATTKPIRVGIDLVTPVKKAKIIQTIRPAY
jgi:hypothetical protein